MHAQAQWDAEGGGGRRNDETMRTLYVLTQRWIVEILREDKIGWVSTSKSIY